MTENFWDWKNSVKIVIAVLIIFANILLIVVIRTSRKCRQQVSSCYTTDLVNLTVWCRGSAW